MWEEFAKFANRLFAFRDVNRLLFFIGLVSLALWVFFTPLAPILFAILLAYVLDGPVSTLARISGIGRTAAATLVIGAAVFLMIIGVYIVPRFLLQLNELILQLPQTIAALDSSFNAINDYLPDSVKIDKEIITQNFGEILTAAGQFLLDNSVAWVGNVFGLFILAVIIPLLLFFMLRDRDAILDYLRRFVPRTPALRELWADMDEQLGAYVRGKIIEAAIIGIITWYCFFYFRLDNALALAILVGLSVFVPFVGIIAVTIPVVLFSFLQFGWSATFGWLMFWYALVQILDGQVLVPLLFSEVVKIHPVAIFASILFFGSIWGVWGVFLAIPMASFVKCLVVTIERYRRGGAAGESGAQDKQNESAVNL